MLVASGVLEAVWASALAASQGFKRPLPTVIFVVASMASLIGLGWAMRTLPPGTSYAVWTAIGATLTAAWAMVTGQERVTTARVLLLVGIVTCVAGLRVVA